VTVSPCKPSSAHRTTSTTSIVSKMELEPNRSSSRSSRGVVRATAATIPRRRPAADAADRGAKRSFGPARRGRRCGRPRPRGRLQVEFHHHTLARFEPFPPGAATAARDLRDVFAIGARPIAILDSAGAIALSAESGPLALPCSIRPVAASPLGTRSCVATVGGEIYFEAPYEQNLTMDQRDVRRADRAATDQVAAAGIVATSLGCSAPRTAATGLGGASLLASAELADADADKPDLANPTRSEKKLLACSARAARESLLFRSRNHRLPRGLTIFDAEMAAQGASRDHLDVPGASAAEADMEASIS